jgi:hypothetical protein
MTNLESSEMAIQIVEHLDRLQVQLEAAKEYILSLPGAPTLEKLDRELFQLESPILRDAASQQQYDEWKHAIQAKDDALDILRSLHEEVTLGKMTA